MNPDISLLLLFSTKKIPAVRPRARVTEVVLAARGGCAKERPVVTFTPNWNAIFTGENVTLRCDVRPADEGYTWYRDSDRIHTGQSFVITAAGDALSGNYQCQGARTDRSDLTRLSVSQGWVILQVPLHIHEGDDVTLRCHHYPGYSARKTKFYKSKAVIRGWESDAELFMAAITFKASGRYRCVKEVYHNLVYYRHRGEAAISVQELFTFPKIKVAPYPASENMSVTLTCDTSLSPLRPGTQLQFAFYKDGQKVQGFGSSNQHAVRSAKVEDSGTFYCEVKSGSVVKRSRGRTLEITDKKKEETEKNSDVTRNAIRHFLSAIVLLIAFVFLYYHIKLIKSLKTGNEEIPSKNARTPTSWPPLASTDRIILH